MKKRILSILVAGLLFAAVASLPGAPHHVAAGVWCPFHGQCDIY